MSDQSTNIPGPLFAILTVAIFVLIFGGSAFLAISDWRLALIFAGCCGVMMVLIMLPFSIPYLLGKPLPKSISNFGSPAFTVEIDSYRHVIYTIVPFLILSMLLFVFDYYRLQPAINSINWTTVLGKITHSSIDSQTSYARNGDMSVSHSANVQYSYTTKGQEYHSAKISFLDDFNRVYCKSIVKKFPEGKVVTVFFDSNHPNESVLQPGVVPSTFTSYGYIFTSLIWVFLSVISVNGAKSNGGVVIVASNLLCSLLLCWTCATHSGPELLLKLIVPKEALQSQKTIQD